MTPSQKYTHQALSPKMMTSLDSAGTLSSVTSIYDLRQEATARNLNSSLESPDADTKKTKRLAAK